MKIETSFAGLDDALAALARELDREAPAGTFDAAKAVADAAVAHHPFQNRSGDLEASIHAEENPHVGLAGADAAVVASEDYASYVDGRAGFAFLEPAAEASEAEQSAALDAALQRAADDAGWKP